MDETGKLIQRLFEKWAKFNNYDPDDARIYNAFLDSVATTAHKMGWKTYGFQVDDHGVLLK